MGNEQLRNQIPLRARGACFRLITDLKALGIRRLTCPRNTLVRLHRLTGNPDKLLHPAFLRIQDYLTRILSRGEDDDSWERARSLEGLVAGLMGGDVIGPKSTVPKADILGPNGDMISLKTHSGAEPMICAGNLSGITGDDFRQFIIMWNRLFVKRRGIDSPRLKKPDGRPLNFRRRPLADLKRMAATSEQSKGFYQNHLDRRRQWRSMLKKSYCDLDSWAIFYIAENLQDFHGEIKIHWFSNADVIKFLAPLDRPPPIVISSDHASNFRFNANSLKEEAPKLEGSYTSGSIFMEDLLTTKHPQISEILSLRNRLCEEIEEADPQRLQDLSNLIRR